MSLILSSAVPKLVEQFNVSTQNKETVEKEKTFKGVFNYLGSKFVPKMMIQVSPSEAPKLLEEKILQTVEMPVHITTRIFDFKKNGFEFKSFTNTALGSAIDVLGKGPSTWSEISEESITTHASCLEAEMCNWGKSQGISFSRVLCIDSVFRNTASGSFGSVHFVHVDFPSGDTKEILRGHSNWKERIIKKIERDLTADEYENLVVTKIVNVWMPLDPKLEAEPLAMMDREVCEDLESQLQVYHDKRITSSETYQSVGVIPHPKQKWYVREMTRGEGVIFDTCQTPHSAVSFPDQGDKTRKSIECRLLFIQE